MEIRQFVISPIRSNCYVLSETLDTGARAVIVDPGDTNLDEVFSYIDEHQFNVIANWNTHAHFDHVIGCNLVRDKYGCPSLLHKADAAVWDRIPEVMYQWVGQRPDPLRAPDGYFADGDTLSLGDETFTVWHTPGHSPGGVCFVGREFALTGDTLFRGTVGRTDLEDSSPEDMEKSLERILTWSDDLDIYPGHGAPTTMLDERQSNRFLRIAARGGR